MRPEPPPSAQLLLLGSSDTHPPCLCASDDIDNMISSARSMLRSANDITDSVLGGLHPIQEDVGRIKDAHGSTHSEDFNQALTDADNSGAGVRGQGGDCGPPRSVLWSL